MKYDKNIISLKDTIKDEKKKIKLLKKKLRNKKKECFKKTKFGNLLNKTKLFLINKQDNYSLSHLIMITIVSIIIGIFATLSFSMIFTGGRNYFKLSKDLGKLYDVYSTLLENYNGDVSKDELIENAISGMVSGVGDVYTSYGDNEAATSFNDLISGVYEGIGCAIQQIDKEIKVAMVYENSPAFKAGLEVGDIILQINDLDAKKENATTLSDYIREKSGKKIIIKVLRGKEEKTFTLIRDKVEIPVVNSKVIETNDKKIGYMNISLFSSVSSKQFINKLNHLEEQEIEGLVIDVRDNNGGYLTEVTNIASYLLPRGKNIYQIEKNKKRIVTKDKTFAKRTYPIAIIVNQNSASASEILAGVIKESYGGYVVGTKTYGKGTVQQVKNLKDGSMVKYTIENWLTPNGNWINEKGIEPTDKVELTEEFFKDPKEENDNQLKKALSLVSK